MQEEKENNTKIIDRIYEYITTTGLTFNKLAIELNISNSYFSKMYKNKGSIGSDIIEKILRIHPDLNADWLITGRGNMILNNVKENIDKDDTLTTDIDNQEEDHNNIDIKLSNKTLERMIERLLKLLDESDNEINNLTDQVASLKAQLAKYTKSKEDIGSDKSNNSCDNSYNITNIA